MKLLRVVFVFCLCQAPSFFALAADDSSKNSFMELLLSQPADSFSFSFSSSASGKACVPASPSSAVAASVSIFGPEDGPITKFECEGKTREEIFQALEEGMGALGAHVSIVQGEDGKLSFVAFQNRVIFKGYWRFDGTREGATVFFHRTWGERMQTTRFFYEVVKASGLANLAIPRLLRQGASRECCAESAKPQNERNELSYKATAMEVYVNMLKGHQLENVRIGVQGLARACCCSLSAKVYEPYLEEVRAVLAEYENPKNTLQPNFVIDLIRLEIIKNHRYVLDRINLSPELSAL